ncbi:hypothetical protein M569_15177, partial [Genlisea aurea]
MERDFGPPRQVFEPDCRWEDKEDADIIKLRLPEFKREHLKVEIVRDGLLKISGARLDLSRTIIFSKEIRLPSISSGINARLVNGWLHVIIPKTRASVQSNTKDGK